MARRPENKVTYETSSFPTNLANCTMCRHYSIDDRSSLRNTKSPDWPQIYIKYLKDLACPMVSYIKIVVNFKRKGNLDIWQSDGSSSLVTRLCD